MSANHELQGEPAMTTPQTQAVWLAATRRWTAGAVLAATLLAGVGTVHAAPEQTLNVDLGTHRLLREKVNVGRVAVGDPKVADVALINRRELLITGKTSGTTSLMVWSQAAARRSDGVPTEYRIRVGYAGISSAQMGGLDVQPGQSISGSTDTLGAHARATAAATPGKSAADLSSVKLDTQVMTDIKIVEVQRNVVNQFGLNILKQSVGHHSFYGAVSPPGSLSGVGSGGSTSSNALGLFQSASGFLPLQNAFNIVVGNTNDGGILGILNVLESSGLARVLAEPSLTAMSGQTATFLAGGEFPVPVAQSSGSSSSGGAAITIQYREFGIRLSLTPTVLSRQEISLKVAPEVSDLDFSNAVTISGTTVPALTVRRTDTTVQLGDGESFVISGLVSNNLSDNVDKVPWLGDLPVIGAFFRTTDYQRKQQELVMVVTPHLVHPLAVGAKLPRLPGEETDRYHPSFADTMFFDTDASAQSDTGYSH